MGFLGGSTVINHLNSMLLGLLLQSDMAGTSRSACVAESDYSYDENFQNDAEEPEGRDRKGSRPGVLRCGYCVKQGNVVSTQLVGTDLQQE